MASGYGPYDRVGGGIEFDGELICTQPGQPVLCYLDGADLTWVVISETAQVSERRMP